jgi:hypothetical protein
VLGFDVDFLSPALGWKARVFWAPFGPKLGDGSNLELRRGRWDVFCSRGANGWDIILLYSIMQSARCH